MAYSIEEKDNIIKELLADVSSGLSVRKAIVNSPIDRDTFYEWVKEDKYSDQYARAAEERADLIFEDILNIADENGNDTRITEDGAEITNHDVINRARLRVDARKWMLGKMQPKKYGDKIELDNKHSGEIKITREIKK